MHETVRTNEFFEIWLIYLTPTPRHQQGYEHRKQQFPHAVTLTRRGRQSILWSVGQISLAKMRRRQGHVLLLLLPPDDA
ncbi:MAG: hypothetical protein OSB39_13180 [Opitutales bacterium]|nr:hypothetical protein [Opitutales bacterium]